MSMTVPRTFAAMGDPVRSRIVDRLAASDATVGEIAALFSISFQAVSQHLGVLERVGLITREREGRTRRVRLQTAPLDEAREWLDARRRRLEQRYERLDAVLAGLVSVCDLSAPAAAARTPLPTVPDASEEIR